MSAVSLEQLGLDNRVRKWLNASVDVNHDNDTRKTNVSHTTSKHCAPGIPTRTVLGHVAVFVEQARRVKRNAGARGRGNSEDAVVRPCVYERVG